ncbi:MAG: 6-hydroxycyclohex-1-ene-1-carbonyl-CoA dehydrogenase [Gammaproteobacteria bacterium]|nr:6-hydroxycyclohex-1-ene-1-carbonyl-CoA dehydrogenase [Gammaproteobacteria bacterium]
MRINAQRWLMTARGEPLSRAEFNPLPPGAGEVVVAVAGCGVCHTDLGFFHNGVRTRHELPLALGHEVSGRVIACGAGTESWRDRSVIIPAVIPCGECDWCQRGKPTICPNQKMPGNDMHGGFGTHILVPARGLCPVDETRLANAGLSLPDVCVIADAVTTPLQAVTRSGVGPGDIAIVIGIGGVGGFSAQIAHAFGAKVVAIDVNQGKLDRISEHGASLTLNSGRIGSRELKQAISAFAEQSGLRQTEWVIFECSGTAAGQQTAFGLITYGSTLCVVGFTMDRIEVRLSNLMAFDARAVGNWGCPPGSYPAALDLVLDGRIKLLPFIERRPLDEINRIFEEAHAQSPHRRIVLVPEL